MRFAVGSLVRVRGREWVVMPESIEDLLIVRPLGGADVETTGIYLPLEDVEPAVFDLPDPTVPGDWRSCRLLRDAVRLGFRSSAGPFRSFARIAVEPRPYQLVPLLMALKLNPIRMLIADDVGIGKTIEALLIARELLDRGEIRRLAVLCPPHLAEQWQRTMKQKFHIDAVLVIPSTARKLEDDCPPTQSLFDLHPFVVVSLDYIKSDRRRADFFRACPEMVIVDEAHSCAFGNHGRGGRQQRHQLVVGLAADKNRHLILVTATPHSGKEDEFHSLLALLDQDFAQLPRDLSGKGNEPIRRRLAAHIVQRRRADIRHYMDADTPFPVREDAEMDYGLTPAYKRLFERAIRYASELVEDLGGTHYRRRVRWWSALALLRSLASSPAAAAATLRSRAAFVDSENVEDVDEMARRSIMDLDSGDATDFLDAVPGSDIEEPGQAEPPKRKRLLEMARDAEALFWEKDAKLVGAAAFIKKLVEEGYNPIVFCRFIPTADYVADYLRKRLPSDVAVDSVTGALPPGDREYRIAELGKSERRVLVATDCLSEGIDLQEHFDAVFHYDLCWNPTRHEQREGRVDRFGQSRSKVRVLTYYGRDNQIDGLVLDVIIKKHKIIHSKLGYIVPVPAETNSVVEALYQGLLLRGGGPGFQYTLDFANPQKQSLHAEWDDATAREKRSRTVFAQESIKVDEVARELKAVQSAVGSGVEVEAFATEAFRASGAIVSMNGLVTIDLKEVPRGLRDAVGNVEKIRAKFQLPVKDEVVYLNRTHPIVEGLANYVMNTALDPKLESIARRSGVIRTDAVSKRTTLLLLRLRYHILKMVRDEEIPLLAEDSVNVVFAGSPQNPEWLDDGIAEALLRAKPAGNVNVDQARDFLGEVIGGYGGISPYVEGLARKRGDELLEAHRRVRSAAGMKWVTYRVEPHLPADVMGIYVCLPAG